MKITASLIYKITGFLYVLIFILCLILSKYEMRINTINIDTIPVLSEQDGVQVFLDNAYYELNRFDGTNVEISGWVIVSGEETGAVAINVLLQNVATQETVQLPTSMNERSDVTNYINDGLNYDNSGFSVSLNSENIDYQDNTYKILLRYKIGNDEYIVDTQKYITQKN